MSIIAFIGLPGSGKSFGIVQNVVVPNLKKGRMIVTNLPLNIDNLRRDLFNPFDAIPIVLLTDEQLLEIDLLKEYAGAIFIIDEAQKYFPQGMTEAKLPTHFKNFFSMHRHSVCPNTGFASEIVLATQDLSKIARCVKILIENTYIAKKLSALGADKSYKVDVYEGAQTIDYRKGEPINEIYGTYKKPFTDYYNSHTMKSDSSIVANEEKADKRASLLSSKKAKFYALCLLALPFYLIWAAFSVKDNLVPADSIESSVVESVSAPVINNLNSQNINPVSNPQPTYQAPRANQNDSYTFDDIMSGLDIDYRLDKDGALVVSRYLSADSLSPVVLGFVPSSEWRYSGALTNDRGHTTHLVVSSSGDVRRLSDEDCFYDARTRAYSCVIGQTQVTSWSGISSEIGPQATNSAPSSSGFL